VISYYGGLRTIVMTASCLLLSTFPASAKAELDVSIPVFDPGVPEDRSLHRDLQVFPRIRGIEALLLPFVLRDTLAGTGEWGAVRVVPEAEPAAELSVSGTIVTSDGHTLTVQVHATDAAGNVWLEQAFTGTNADNFQGLFDAVAAALALQSRSLSPTEAGAIREISMLRYAQSLAPSAFAGYLSSTADGRYAVIRLPARNDPMLERIHRLRETGYVITDAVDAKFQELHAEIATVYEVWREYRRKNVSYQDEQVVQADATSSAMRGSYEYLKNLYDNYKWDRMAAQEQDRLAVAFHTEVGPRVNAMEQRVAELDGWIDEKQDTWNRLLEELFEAETSAQKAFEENALDQLGGLVD
jgi:hypothetical protein